MTNLSKTLFIVLFLLINAMVLSFLGISFIHDRYFKIKKQPEPNHKVLQQDIKYILYWIPMWKKDIFLYGRGGGEPFQNCKFQNCFATGNRELVEIYKYAAIIFDGVEYCLEYKLPWIRLPTQRYIFATMESPFSTFSETLKLFPSFYNWTMTYRLDSDIPIPYGHIIKNSTNYTIPNLEFIKNKTNIAAWIVSNCESSNHRENVYNKLSKILKIDVYGRCGTFKCPGEDKLGKERSPACYDFIANTYKFYLSFENAHCKDYVTEKLYRALERNIVPIVYGLVDYDDFAPPHSVIVVEKFQSITALADYIFYLDKNPKEYLKYFEWKKNYYVNRYLHVSACKLCEMLNNPLESEKIYTDIDVWWSGENQSYCKFVNKYEYVNISKMIMNYINVD